MSHISMNPDFDNLPKEIREIEKYVFLQKKVSYLISKRRYLEQNVAFCQDDDLRKQILKEIKEVEDNIRKTKKQYSEGLVHDLKFVIKAYMKLYRLKVEDLAKQCRTTPEIIKNCLEKGFQTKEEKRFAIWAIRTFRLDANLYLNELYND